MFLDAFIAIFFFLVGLEIKNGIKDFKTAIVPIVAALGGMIVPAAIYLIINPGSHVWAASMPTDIALALGVLSILGKRVNPHVRLFLLTLAIADDLFSLIVLAIFYGNDLEPIKALTTLGAAAIGFILPLRTHLLHKIIKVLTPVSTFFIVPVIVMANIPLDINISAFTSQTTIAIIIARSVGKIIGITLFAWLVLQFGGHAKIGIKEITGVATLAGMGLTVALVIADIAARSETELDQVRLGLFISAILSGLAGYIWLRRTPAPK
jgi:NhaA family Na+:H+ antiporter